ncbi:hypothetical protein CT0861_11682 [Colletotrichum tofieldiae]|uniref:Tachykinin family protein n=1 Tax=Colletotrichum tofieldiae TaxID=708197 RepID=A0A166WC08_9PEZI|nr:hypothetical protein CT0861_11682 [Colletotrichum tofieldiae]
MSANHLLPRETWQGVADAKLRRKLQNRLNQRLSRKRKATEREVIAQALAARHDNSAAIPRPILPKPVLQSSDADEPALAAQQVNESSRLGENIINVGHSHGAASQQTLGAPTTLPRGISTFFAAYPDLLDPHFLRIFQFTITSLLPTVGYQTAAGEPLQAALCRAAMSDPLVFHAVLVGGASQLTFRTRSIEDNRVLLKAESQIARTVHLQLSAGTTTISDTVLFAIMSMALKQNTYLLSLAPKDRYAGDFDTPVKSFGGLDWMGLIDMAPDHTAMWMYLLKARDASLSDKVPGLIDYLQATDLLRASALLQKPRMEMQEAFRFLADEAAAIRPDTSEADAFHVEAHFKNIILDIRICCQLIDTFLGGEHPISSETSRFIHYRNLVLYRLLSLPPGVSEMCRLTILIFNYGVLYPFPDPRLLWKLTRQLAAILSDSEYTPNEDVGCLLWSAVIGGIAAAGTIIYDSFVASVSTFASVLGLDEWSDTVDLLQSFVWQERACGIGGRALWARARALSLRVLDPSGEGHERNT